MTIRRLNQSTLVKSIARETPEVLGILLGKWARDRSRHGKIDGELRDHRGFDTSSISYQFHRYKNSTFAENGARATFLPFIAWGFRAFYHPAVARLGIGIGGERNRLGIIVAL